MKYLFTLLFIIPLTFSLRAQSNYKPGYIVNSKNDTIHCFIDYRERFNNPKIIYYKTSINALLQNISIADANAMGITGHEQYEKFVAPVSQGYVALSRLSNKIDTSYITDTIFLKVINKGTNISLYAYTDNIKTRYYILNNADKVLTELKNYVYLNEETHETVTTNSYRLRLLSFAGKYKPDNKDLPQKINYTEYEETDLLKVVQLINGSNGINATSGNTFGTRFFLGAGVKANKIIFTGNAFNFPDGTHESTISPTASGGVDFYLNKDTKRLFFRAEASVTQANYSIPNTVIDFAGTTVSLNFKQLNFTLEPQIIYNFYSTLNFKAFAGVGLAVNFASYNNYKYVTTYHYNDPKYDYNTTETKTDNLSSTWFSLPIKLGVGVGKNLEIYAAYWTPAALTKIVGSSVNISSFQGGINYLFGAK